MFDYEWATVQHNVNCRLAQAVVVPDAIPPERLDRYGARAQAAPLRRAEGGVLPRRLRARSRRCSTELGLDPAQPIAVVRTPPAVSLYHRFENDAVRRACCERLRGSADRRAAARAPSSGRSSTASSSPSSAIDAQSLIAFADLVISAGGTMNREAVALGTPVWTTFEGRLGAVDERLIAEGRLRRLERPEELELAKRAPGAAARARAPRPRAARRPALLARRLTAAPQGARPARR